MVNPKINVPATILAPSQTHNRSATVEKRTGFIAQGDKTEINWVHTFMLVVPPLIGIYGLFTTPMKWQSIALSFFMYFVTGFGITAGYHRLYSHRAYHAHPILRWFLLLAGAGAFQGSAKWWCRNHRAHHRYTDTEKDPYNAKRGFWYSHLGWMIQKQSAKQIGFADITDLNRDPMVQFQHKYYAFLSIGVGLVLPTLIAALWDDMWGGYIYAGVWRMVAIHHTTFSINSFAHHIGEKSFSDLHTAFDSTITALLTLGEGYHNYHHEFPQDYRNGIKFYHYDPTKWFINFFNYFGITYNLKSVTDEEIKKAHFQMKQRNLNVEKAKLNYGRQLTTLPALTWDDIKRRNTSGDSLIVIDGIVHDVKEFVHDHPGGRQTLLNFVGTDSSLLFAGSEQSHAHSKEARAFLKAMRVGLLKESDIGA